MWSFFPKLTQNHHPQETLSETDHRFNDDLLATESARRRACEEFPTIIHVLDHPALRKAFENPNNRANLAKNRSQLTGFLAVVCASIALVAAAAEPVWGEFSEPWPTVIAVTSAILGVMAALIAAGGLLYGVRKIQWLEDRLLSERLRQLHFQTMVFRLPAIADSCNSEHPDGRSSFEKMRDQWLCNLVDHHQAQADSDLEELLDPQALPEIWLHATEKDPRPGIPAGFDPTEIFRAYRALRFNEQIGYCDYKLREIGESLIFQNLPLRKQQRFLRAMWLIAFVGLIGVHIVIIGADLVQRRHAHSPFFPILVICFAIIALAARTLEEGLALPREIERYEDYRTALHALRDRFDRAENHEQMLDTMVGMERLSFEEMRSFLRAHYETSFIL